MAIVGADGGLRSMTTEAAGWFDEIGSLRRLHDAGAGTDVPSEVVVTVMRARAAGRASCRVRTKAGTWLLIHASSLTGTGDTAVIVEPAKASEVAPLIVEAYELTAREVEVTRRLARGLTTNEIAADLHLSRHTVADHLKAVYEKVGVCSRGELVAKMFADHYSDNLHVGLDRAAA
jgi:DNA-binding NarL/FixJ family response regulator